MKVGMIVEGIPDLAVCEYLAKRIKPDIEIETLPLGKKPNLIAKCGDSTRLLLEDGCERVVIIWDLYPATWPDDNPGKRKGRQRKKPKPCRKEDRESIMKSLRNADVDISKVFLVCIDAMLETWLLAGNRAIEGFLSKSHRPVRVKSFSIRELKQNKDPKNKMMTIFRQAGRSGRKPYNDVKDAIKIAVSIPKEPNDYNKLKKINTFSRFVCKVAGVKL